MQETGMIPEKYHAGNFLKAGAMTIDVVPGMTGPGICNDESCILSGFCNPEEATQAGLPARNLKRR